MHVFNSATELKLCLSDLTSFDFSFQICNSLTVSKLCCYVYNGLHVNFPSSLLPCHLLGHLCKSQLLWAHCTTRFFYSLINVIIIFLYIGLDMTLMFSLVINMHHFFLLVKFNQFNCPTFDLACKAISRKAKFGATSASKLMLIPLMFLQVVRALIIKANMIAFTVAYSSYSSKTLSPGRIQVKVPPIPVCLLPV